MPRAIHRWSRFLPHCSNRREHVPRLMIGRVGVGSADFLTPSDTRPMYPGTMCPWRSPNDRIRVFLVALTAILQALVVPLATRALGPRARIPARSLRRTTPNHTGRFLVLRLGTDLRGLYRSCDLPAAAESARASRCTRRTGWWLTGAFTANTVSVLMFGAQAVWLAQSLLVILVISIAGIRGSRLPRRWACAECCGDVFAAATRDDLSRLGGCR